MSRSERRQLFSITHFRFILVSYHNPMDKKKLATLAVVSDNFLLQLICFSIVYVLCSLQWPRGLPHPILFGVRKIQWSCPCSLFTQERKYHWKWCPSKSHFRRYFCSRSAHCLVAVNWHDNAPSSSGPSQGTDSSSSVGIQLSTKSTTGIVFGVLGILVHIFIAWRKRRQLLWCFTGGRHGQKPTIKKTPGGSSSVPDENQLSSLPPHSGPGYPPADVSQQSAIINGPNQQISNSGR